MPRPRLYKYFSDRKWAEEFFDGKLLFRSLAYFRDYEDNHVRSDDKEGTSVYRPNGGLIINNLTQGTTFTLPYHAFESSAKQDEIFVYCLSRSLSEMLRQRFDAAVCVEVLDVAAFCTRITAALPPAATFPGQSGKTKIGWRVDYYNEAEAANPRWALPDMIATAKSKGYAWQEEFRLVFSLTKAFAFENVTPRLVHVNSKDAAKPDEHHKRLVCAQGLRDICRLVEFNARMIHGGIQDFPHADGPPKRAAV
ncbi:hypothetical protein WS62_14020 [Burkholderia sp. ABCPW 14]|uniref:hypothetical protein n=1 Tax=Burkholderia sp. ABCPW 14 TaxID=1637860 RepID=UPI000770BB09|nr:hypothetical protein [Burkholderia sp. ABCPW 14]KVD68856.1 hypothetical protein WS62_14020 [Burkholderia sp. ABCPW 14]